MKPDYQNWVPRGMISGGIIAVVFFLMMGLLVLFTHRADNLTVCIVFAVIFFALSLILLFPLLWCILAYRAFSYEGKKQLSRKIIQGVSREVVLPEGAKGLDVGCGSGALTIEIARQNPRATMVGIDRWGKEYASFNQRLCEENALAEGVNNVSFLQGDAKELPFEDHTFDFVTSNYVYHNIPGVDRQNLLLETLRVLKKGGTFVIHDLMDRHHYGDMDAFVKKLKDMGYEEVQLVPSLDWFLTKKEEQLYFLRGSTILRGRK